ncbi:MAG: aminoacyltransferase [Bacteroidales bacterium]|jgi:hypothetical protein|nr:aminoacyltransferase [Bacteroidales bacterium]
MIRYLKHTEIDKQRWDDCIYRAVNSRIYAYSWYLDRICPGWEALVEDDYSCVFPLTGNYKWGIHYLYQPFFAQQLGLFSSELLTWSKLNEFLSAIPGKFRFIQIHLNSLNKPEELPVSLKLRINHELDMIAPYENLAKNYSQNTRRNLKKAMDAGIILKRNTVADELVNLFKENFGQKEGKLKFRHYEMMRNLIQYFQKTSKGYLLGAFSADGILSSMAFFVQDQSRIYLLFAASTPLSRENGAMFMLVDTFIRDHSGQALTLDFEGGNDPSLGRFYKGFGAMEISYPVLKINRLPWLINQGFHLNRKFWK